jgi:hypothetical protein
LKAIITSRERVLTKKAMVIPLVRLVLKIQVTENRALKPKYNEALRNKSDVLH